MRSDDHVYNGKRMKNYGKLKVYQVKKVIQEGDLHLM